VQFKRSGKRYQLRFESGDKIIETLFEFLTAREIGHAAMSGIGALRHATVSYWNAQTGEYEYHDLDEQMELVSFIGNVSLKEGLPFVHAHVALGRSDLSVVGGHFNEGIVNPNVEIWLQPERKAVVRALDESCGLYLMQLPERL
jgi:uncharacterized protein